MYTLVTSLHALGVPVSVIVLNHGTLENKLQNAGINVIVLDENKINGFKILLNLTRVIRNTRPDVIHTHRHKENILGSIAALVAGNTPSMRTIHGVRKKPSSLQISQRIINFLNRVTGCYLQKRIIAVSEDLASILADEFPRSKIRVIENGIDLDDLSRHAGKQKTRQHEDIFRVGIVGRLVPVKRVDIFIAAAAYLAKQNLDRDIRFLIFGDGPLREELESLNRKSGTNNIVSFLGHKDDIQRHIQNLDALLMTSNHEGLPMVLLEAMALRVPIIAHNIGGIPSLLDHGTCGILIGSQDPADYARAVIRLKGNPELRLQLVDKAFARVTSKYSAKSNAQACLTEYTSLMNPAE